MDKKLAELVKRLKEFAGGNLESVILYGSAARGEYRESRSDLNVLCTMKSLSVTELGRVARVVEWWSKELNEPPLRFFTAQELRQSADVFSIELLEMQRSHRVLHGPDVIAAIAVPTNLHRVQVEHDLYAALLKLRQHFLLAGQDHKPLRVVFAKSISSVLVLLRHTLIAFDGDAPAETNEVVARIAAVTGADGRALQAAVDFRDSGILHGEFSGAYGGYMNALEHVIRALDQQIPKREWQRTDEAES
jgi:predicted nucleotidyltransferase